MRTWLSIVCLPLVWAASSKATVTPIQKVLEMLGGMLEKGKERKHAEMVEWSAFKTFCTDVELEKQTAIQAADVQKEALTADIEKHNSEVARLAKEVTAHEAAIEGYKKDQTKATTDRDTDRTGYVATRKDYSESITAITNAIAMLKKQSADVPQAASMLQAVKGYAHLPSASKRAIDSFLSLADDSSAMNLLAAPEANAYEFQSDSIIKMLEELKVKFTDELTTLEKKELTARQATDMVQLDLRNSIAAAENEISKKTHAKAQNAADSTTSSSLFDEVKASRDDDQKYLTDLTTTCQQKSTDFNSRQKLREEELTAIEKAIEIISGTAVSGAAEKHLPSLLQARRSTSFVQFLSASERAPAQQKALLFLNEESQRLGSHVLSAMAVRMTDDPFEKVKKLISDMIVKLQKQEAEEADHKKWCDDELKTNTQTRKDKTTEVDTLTSTIDQLESRLAVLKKDLGSLSAAIAEINAAVAKASELRANEKDANEATIVEAVNGQTAIAQARKILNDFYKKAGDATALAQVGQEPPATFDSSFTGQQQQGNNVLAFLDVISSDFARLETDTQKAESAAQSEHDTFMAASKTAKEAKELEVKTKEKEQLDKTGELSTANDDLDSAHAQLDAALDYFDKLKPSCLNVAQPFEERVTRREDEIAALKEALEILNGESLGGGTPDGLYSSTQGGNLAVDNKK